MALAEGRIEEMLAGSEAGSLPPELLAKLGATQGSAEPEPPRLVYTESEISGTSPAVSREDTITAAQTVAVPSQPSQPRPQPLPTYAVAAGPAPPPQVAASPVRDADVELRTTADTDLDVFTARLTFQALALQREAAELSLEGGADPVSLTGKPSGYQPLDWQSEMAMIEATGETSSTRRRAQEEAESTAAAVAAADEATAAAEQEITRIAAAREESQTSAEAVAAKASLEVDLALIDLIAGGGAFEAGPPLDMVSAAQESPVESIQSPPSPAPSTEEEEAPSSSQPRSAPRSPWSKPSTPPIAEKELLEAESTSSGSNGSDSSTPQSEERETATAGVGSGLPAGPSPWDAAPVGGARGLSALSMMQRLEAEIEGRSGGVQDRRSVTMQPRRCD